MYKQSCETVFSACPDRLQSPDWMPHELPHPSLRFSNLFLLLHPALFLLSIPFSNSPWNPALLPASIPLSNSLWNPTLLPASIPLSNLPWNSASIPASIPFSNLLWNSASIPFSLRPSDCFSDSIFLRFSALLFALLTSLIISQRIRFTESRVFYR